MANKFHTSEEKTKFEEYFSIFENINEAVCINTKEGEIFFVNGSALDLFGYSRDELIGMNIRNLYAKSTDRPSIIKILEQEGFLKDFPVKLKKKNGEIMDCEFNTNIKEDNKGNKIVYGFIRNVTERNVIEDRIKESEEKYRTLFDTLADIIIYVDKHGNLLDTNNKVKDILGYERDEIIGKNFKDLKLIDTSELPKLIKLFIKTISSGKVMEKYELTLRNKNEDTVYFEVATQFIKKDQNVMGAVSVLRDITERRILKESLEKEREMLYSLLNEIPGYICLYSPDLSILFANTLLEQQFGEIDGKKCYEIFHGFKDRSHAPCNNCPVIRVFETGILEKTERLQKNGKIYEIYDYPFRDTDGKYLVMEFGIDVTEKKLAGSKIIELNDTLRLLNKILRHDILNNLMVISANIELIESNDKDKIDKTFEYIHKSAKLINRMKELESLVSTGFELKNYDVKSILKEISKNNSDIKFNIDGNCIVLADDALSSVFDNIIRNAIIHGNTGKIDIKIKSNIEYCEIRFSDYGKCIPHEIKNRLFDEGFAYGENKGTGLGLYIVKKTLERYGGTIDAEDNLPKGTTFIVKLRKGRNNR